MKKMIFSALVTVLVSIGCSTNNQPAQLEAPAPPAPVPLTEIVASPSPDPVASAEANLLANRVASFFTLHQRLPKDSAEFVDFCKLNNESIDQSRYADLAFAPKNNAIEVRYTGKSGAHVVILVAIKTKTITANGNDTQTITNEPPH